MGVVLKVSRWALGALLAWVLGQAIPAAIASDLAAPTAAELLAPPALTDPEMSPDGTQVAARLDGSALALFDLSKPGAAAAPVMLPQGERLEW